MDWQTIWKQNITSWKALCAYLELEIPQPPASHFSLSLPRRLANKIDKGDLLHDPIFKQFVPDLNESRIDPACTLDPLGEGKARCAPKGLKKYAHRFLLVTTSACAMHCRYCFRQAFAYSKKRGFEEELAAIRDDSSIQEVILSGGDPLALSDAHLDQLLQELTAIAHVQRVRIHSRFLIGIPERVTPTLIELLSHQRFPVWFVLHCNHPREWDRDIADALAALRKAGIPLLHQSVLLQGVNDSVEVLVALYELLANQGIHPYYLHKLDPVPGTSHFAVPVETGRALIQNLYLRLPGYAVPTYVEERAGALSKIRL